MAEPLNSPNFTLERMVEIWKNGATQAERDEIDRRIQEANAASLRRKTSNNETIAAAALFESILQENLAKFDVYEMADTLSAQGSQEIQKEFPDKRVLLRHSAPDDAVDERPASAGWPQFFAAAALTTAAIVGGIALFRHFGW